MMIRTIKVDEWKTKAKSLFDDTIYKANLKGKAALREVVDAVSPFTDPDKDELVRSLVMNTAALELTKGQHIELAPIRGTCGAFTLTGNSLPVFTYRVFEKQLMEFIKVVVEVARPGQIRFLCTIDSEGTQDPVNHGKEVECRDAYKTPFNRLARSLFTYFPYYRTMVKHGNI